MAFIHEDFLLHNETARRLYHHHAARQPVLDYHSHLSSRDIAAGRRFRNLYEIWLDGDHYKWRAMRANGIDERFVTGDAPPFEKFLAWARTVPFTVRNPLYHWTHLELSRYFGIDFLLNESSARQVWDHAGDCLESADLSARGILQRFGVKVLCTTDDPADGLDAHRTIRESGLATRVYPTYRPDRSFNLSHPEEFNRWVNRLEAAADVHVLHLDDFLMALERRHGAFHELGCRLSDHGLERCPDRFITEKKAARIFAKARAGKPISPKNQARFAAFMMLWYGRLDARRGWTQQLHLGAMRNVNRAQLERIGPDTGYDSIGDCPQGESLGKFLNQLESENALPRTILYNLNPADNFLFATLAGNFQQSPVAGKIQYGSGWWFLDQKDGIIQQLNALSNAGLLAHFVGMVTDSRSFMSFTRHEYFRRVLCNLLGAEMESGELPADEAQIGTLVENVCYHNAERYLNLP